MDTCPALWHVVSARMPVMTSISTVECLRPSGRCYNLHHWQHGGFVPMINAVAATTVLDCLCYCSEGMRFC